MVLVSVWEVSVHRKGKPLFSRAFSCLRKIHFPAKQRMGNDWALHFVSLASAFQKSTLKSQQIVNRLGMETCKWWKLAEVIPKDCVCATRGGIWCPEPWQTGSVPCSILHFSWNCSFEDLIIWCQETLQIAQHSLPLSLY